MGPKPNPNPDSTLIMIRHGESQLNYNRTFTGWVDADLNERGVREVEHAARLLLERGYEVDVTYTSRLKRAIRSSWILMTELHQIYRPVYKSWRLVIISDDATDPRIQRIVGRALVCFSKGTSGLSRALQWARSAEKSSNYYPPIPTLTPRLNERMYGALEGMSKPGLAAELGEDVVQSFRTGLTARPPPMAPDHPHWHHGEKKYADLAPEEIPVTESLQDTMVGACVRGSIHIFLSRQLNQTRSSSPLHTIHPHRSGPCPCGRRASCPTCSPAAP